MSFQRSLVISGAALFLLGLLQGAVVQSFTNPRMALSAHLTAVQSGTVLMVVGVVWSVVSLNAVFSKIARWSIMVGMYGLWIGLTLSATTGASASLPIAGAGHDADRLTEMGVSIMVLGSSALMTIGWFFFLAGLIRSKGD